MIAGARERINRVFAWTAGFLLLASSLQAQGIDEAVTIEDLGFTQRLNAGARATGLAGAYTSIGDDTHALVYNPAGLARVRRIELGVGFQHERLNLENRYFGSDNEVDLSGTGLDYLSAAYPLPTYRGSFVVAGGVYRVHSSDVDILNRSFNTNTSAFDDYRLQQSGSIYSYNFGLGVDLSPVLSAGANLFFMDGTIKALTQFTEEFLPPFSVGDTERQALVDDAEVDLDGYGAILGIQYHPHPLFRAGISVSTPVPINIEGDAIGDFTEYKFNSVDELTTEAFFIDTDYQIPFRVDFGFSFSPPPLLVSVDIGYSDWRQAEINDIQLKDEDLDAVFREVVDFRTGVEVAIPRSPVRVRGGYARLPYPLKYLQAERIYGDRITEATVQTERQLVAAGVGFLVGQVLTIDAAYEYQLGEREIDTLNDERRTKRFLMSASYRF